jgi:hypothetical protein
MIQICKGLQGLHLGVPIQIELKGNLIKRPRNYKVPNFSTFFEDDEKTAYEYISRITIQCGELSNILKAIRICWKYQMMLLY